MRLVFIISMSVFGYSSFGQDGYGTIDSLAQECLKALKTNFYTDFCKATMPLEVDFEEIYSADSLKKYQLIGALKKQPGWETRALGHAQFKFISLRQSKIGGATTIVDSLALKTVDFATPSPSHSYSDLLSTSVRLVLIDNGKLIKIDLGQAVKTTRGWVLMDAPE